MEPSQEIVDLARRFHELGGTKEIEGHYSVGHWVVAEHGVWLLDGGYNQLKTVMEKDMPPIITESELWEWLRSNITRNPQLRVTQRGFFQADQWLLTVQVESGDIAYYEIKHSLHEALYRAAVLVAEKQKETGDNLWAQEKA